MTVVSTFVASGSPVSFMPLDTATTIAMPTVDASNTDLMLTNFSGGVVYLTFGTPIAVGSQLLQGEVILRPTGQPVLLTATAATAAASSADPAVIYSTTHATAASVSAIATMRGGSVTLQRGTATPRNTF